MTMRPITLFPLVLAFVIVGADMAEAQRTIRPRTQRQSDAGRIEIVPMVGWLAGGIIPLSPTGDLDLRSAVNFGGTIAVNVRPNAYAELIYNHQSTTLDLKTGGGAPSTELFDMSVDYFHIGGVAEAYSERRFKPFGGASLGATLFSPAGNRDDEWRFSSSFVVGAKTFANERVGFRFQTRLWFTFIDTSDAFFCRAGSCVAAVRTTIFSQFEFSGGLILAF